MTDYVTDVSNRVHLDDVARWRDAAGVVHIVGRHMRCLEHCDVFADCNLLIARVLGTQNGFYEGDGSRITTCLGCLGMSNFETYAPR